MACMSSASEIPANVLGDGGTCCACLLHHISSCLSSATLAFAPSSLLHQRISALPLLLDRLLSITQHPQWQNEPHERLFPASSLLHMDILQLLLHISENLRVLLVTVAGSYGDDAHALETTKEEVGLLDGSVRDVRLKGCLEFLSPFLSMGIGHVQEKSSMKDVQMRESSEFGKRLMEVVRDLARYSQALQLSLENMRLKLSCTAELITSMFMASSGQQQHATSCATNARLRTCIRSFLYADHAEAPTTSDHPAPASGYGDEWLAKEAEVAIEKLLNPRGPSIVGIGGRSGGGKSCLASQIASDIRIVADFPGGVLSLSVGREPDLTSLQASLWECMRSRSICYSTSCKSSFSSLEEGTAALLARVREWLPCLVVLDDVWNVDHVRPFMFFEGKENGRILVVSEIVESVLGELEGDVFVHVLDSLREVEATCVFNSVAACCESERASTWAACARKCGGIPRLLEAAASIVYYEKARGLTLPSVVSLLKQGVIVDLETKPPLKVVSAPGFTDGWKDQPEQQEDSKTSPLEVNTWNLLVFFDVLAEVHPSLQECFLDLAAFPKGKWLSSSMLVDVWSFGDGMEKERVFFVLGFFASRSLIEWKVERLDGELEEDLLLQFRLAGEFYDLAKALSKRRLEETRDNYALNNRKLKNYLCRVEQIREGQRQDVNDVLNLLLSVVDAFDTFIGQVNQKGHSGGSTESCYVQEHSNLRLNDIHAKMKMASRRGPRSHPFGLLRGDYRLFIPGSDEGSSKWWNKQTLLNKTTKLSLVSGISEKFPSRVKLPNLKIALLRSNEKLQRISASTLKGMEKLVVLDLTQCTSLTKLPDSICTLRCLELLELSSCTHLISLPQSVGKLRNLRCLRLSGCLSLTCLPMSLGSLSNLAMLDLSMCGRLKWLPNTLGHLSCLQTLNLSGCYSLQCLPATMALLRKLTIFVVSGCCNLSHAAPWFERVKIMAGWRTGGTTAIPLKLWKLGQIEVLHLCSLKNLTYLPQSVGKLQHLRHLNLSSCRSLDHLPDELGSLFLLEKLDLSRTAIRKLPTTVGQLNSLMILRLRGCSRLMCIPPSMSALPKLECLEMAECWDFVMLPVEFGHSDSVPELLLLDLSGSSLKQLPQFGDGALPMLREFNLSGCQNLLSLPDTLGKLTTLEKINVEGCRSLSSLQGLGLASLKQLQWLNLRNCLSLTSLPVFEMQALQSLKFLDVSGCTKLSPFPEPLLLSAKEHRFTLVRWGTVWH